MNRFSIFLAVLAFALAGAVHAQMFKWVDKDGKVRYGDTPPPGVKATALKGSSAPAAPAANAGASKGAAKGPLTPAEQEQEYRKRQAEEQKSSAKATQEQRDKADKKDNCESAKNSLNMLESGQRIARTNPSGERYYLDEAQIAQEVAKARESMQRACN